MKALDRYLLNQVNTAFDDDAVFEGTWAADSEAQNAPSRVDDIRKTESEIDLNTRSVKLLDELLRNPESSIDLAGTGVSGDKVNHEVLRWNLRDSNFHLSRTGI